MKMVKKVKFKCVKCVVCGFIFSSVLPNVNVCKKCKI
jgi:hypothetical protein